MMTVIQLTWKEILRKRVLLVTFLLTVVFLSLYWFAVSKVSDSVMRFSNSSDLLTSYLRGTLFISAGLYFANFVIAFLMIFSAVGTISSEIETGILLAILPRPISRWKIYIGKWIGYAAWGVAYSCLLFGALTWIVHWKLHYPVDLDAFWKGIGLFVMIPLILSALSMLGSTYLPTLSNGIAIVLLFCLGLLGGVLEQILSLDVHLAQGAGKVGLLTGFLIPTDSIYRRMTFEMMGGSSVPLGRNELNSLGPFGISAIPSNAFLWYTGVYICVSLIWGALHFSRRDV